MNELISLIFRTIRAVLYGLLATIAVFAFVRIIISCTIGTDNNPPPPPQIAAMRARFAWVHPFNEAIALAAGLVVGMLAIRKRRQPYLPPLCIKCGYDLTGDESGVCPECGERI